MEKLPRAIDPIFPGAPHTWHLDVEYEYRQESNLYYLTGFDGAGGRGRAEPVRSPEEVHAVRGRADERGEAYAGRRPGVDGAMQAFPCRHSAARRRVRAGTLGYLAGQTLYYTSALTLRSTRWSRKRRPSCAAPASPHCRSAPIWRRCGWIKTDATSLAGAACRSTFPRRPCRSHAGHPAGHFEYEVQAVFEYSLSGDRLATATATHDYRLPAPKLDTPLDANRRRWTTATSSSWIAPTE